MYDSEAATSALAEKIDAVGLSEGTERRALMAQLLRMGKPFNAFARKNRGFKADVYSRMQDGDLVGLAAVAVLANAEADFELALEGKPDVPARELLHIGRKLLHGEFEDLNDVVESTSNGGWESVGHSRGVKQELSFTTRLKIVAAVRAKILMDHAWHWPTGGAGMISADEQYGRDSGRAVDLASGARNRLSETEQPQRPQFEGGGQNSKPVGEAALLPTIASVLSRPIPARRLVFGEMGERGTVTMLAAAPGIGKTTLGVHVACAVASGKDWAGFHAPTAGHVLYLNAEDSQEEVARRFAAVKLAGGLNDDAAGRVHLAASSEGKRLFERGKAGLGATEEGKRLMKIVEELQPALIIVDPFVMVHGADENSNAEMAAVIGYMAELARAGDASVLLIHHAGKDQKDGLGAARGASSMPAAVRSMWSLSYVEKQSEQAAGPIRLSCVKSNHHARGNDRLFKRMEVGLPNGDMVGLLEPVTGDGGRVERVC